ncbi:MAG: PLP-dependent aminotransferase family protein [Bacteroidales bacterium]|jgi:2-aminoadipate transaminase|nr:PLP-dependent aminotransferase family protein [Bacteroidales bacterium]MDD2824397.1 PLP-dependent aminotransferase family protein [Bacteroidales bacterium]MDD3100757.1 PLP-dependent aminotransferase family protein [Bacteroidales bacterium]MDD3639791.1 PLP-dependent aminotransferase family protein [Bacteroidales bacterium]MDD3944377.1 PLP-dependent aminotransferase family protein [Bacteroidales bacterium]
MQDEYLNSIISDNARNMRRSAIRDLLKMATRPEVISFGGGFPDITAFPVEELRTVVNEVLDENALQALQYGETLGVKRLREVLASRYRDQGMDVTYENFIITTSSQQAIDMVTQLFINPGDTIVCGLPSYLGALQAFNAHRANPVGIPKDEELHTVVNALVTAGRKPKFIYAIPDFQNPSGVTMNMKQRKNVLEVARQFDLLIVEDSPYREIRFSGEPMPLIFSLDKEGRTLLLGTFSKTFIPGFRLGWVMGPVRIIEKLETVKQSLDLCAPVFNQYIAARYIEKGYYDKNIERIKINYRHKRDNMISAFEKYMPEGVTWTNPEGGLFLFVTLPEGYDAAELFKIAVNEDVAFVIGEAFHCDGSGKNTLRINFSYMEESRAEEGVRRLANAIRKMMQDRKLKDQE